MTSLWRGYIIPHVMSTFFTHDKSFYKTLFSLLGFVALQNVVAYTINMADNIMLGRYSEISLSGAAAVNQIFFLVQQLGIAIGATVVALSAQYWGQKKTGPIRTFTGYALKLSFIVSVCLIISASIFPVQFCAIFSNDPLIIAEGAAYLKVVVWSFALFLISNVLYSALRAVGIVKISFYTSIVTLVINCGINYLLIFGSFGCPEMGITGAAVGTITARAVEFVIILIYCKKDRVLALVDNIREVFRADKVFREDFYYLFVPNMGASVLWAMASPIQTAILGHISSDAIAANSVSSTFYQYEKVVVSAMSTCSSVVIGQAIGRGNDEEVKQYGRTLSVLDIILGIILGLLMIALKDPLLSIYNLNPNAISLAGELIILQGFIMMGMSYQMPVSFGIMQGAGDARFTMKMNLISTWAIVMPLTFLSAFLWHLPVVWIVFVIQSDQFFKCIPVFIHFRSYKWIKHLTR